MFYRYLLLLFGTIPLSFALYGQISPRASIPSYPLYMVKSSREDEIRRKILNLRREGKIKPSPEVSDFATYEDKVKRKLGPEKSKVLGFVPTEEDEVDRISREIDSEVVEEDKTPNSSDDSVGRGRIGSMTELSSQDDQVVDKGATALDQLPSDIAKIAIDPSLFKDSGEKELSDDDLVQMVAAKLDSGLNTESSAVEDPGTFDATSAQDTTTTGVGGTWQKQNKNITELYKPKSGSWGAFPRPKDISKAYGGGRRVGAGFSNEDDTVSNMNTKRLLKEYRRKAGIDVPTEKEHAVEIEEALQIAQIAMQRGVYATAVSALEKVTRWCSTNSKVGSKVFLELAMAYEAVGRTQEAYQVYKTLTTCRMEDVKYNAKKLLYGLEAMEIMKDVSADFSRQKIKNTFMDATGLRDIAKNFDDVYQTAYVDLSSGYYKRLTESVVRSNREARQILMQATGKGEVGRMKVVQALRSMARNFDQALEMEVSSKTPVEPTAYLNGKPLVAVQKSESVGRVTTGLDEFVLSSPEQMMTNLDGLWKLQLLADKQGDGVSFYNTTTAVQNFSIKSLTYSASGRLGLAMVKTSGKFEMENASRIIRRYDIRNAGGTGNFLSMFWDRDSGFSAAVCRPQQIVSVDSVLLVTKSPAGTRKGKNAEKEHFGVWRRVMETDT